MSRASRSRKLVGDQPQTGLKKLLQAAKGNRGAQASWKPLPTWRKRSLARHLVLGSGPVDRPLETGLELVLIHLALSVTAAARPIPRLNGAPAHLRGLVPRVGGLDTNFFRQQRGTAALKPVGNLFRPGASDRWLGT